MFTDEELQIIGQIMAETTIQIKSPLLPKILAIMAKVKEKLEATKEK